MSKINDILCGIILPFFMVSCGVFFAFKLRFFYIFRPFYILKELRRGGGSFRSLCIALAGTLGVGNIVGVASAILCGGYGAVFWMWVSALLAMGIKYVEVYLAMKSQRVKNGALHGGAPYYIYDGFSPIFGKRTGFILGAVFSIFCVINSFTTGNLVQVNSVSSLLPISSLVFGIIFAVLIFLIVFKGSRSIGIVNSILIPILTIFYIGLCAFVLLRGYKKIPSAFFEIIEGAFSVKSAFFGVTGYGIATGIRYGVSRGLLSNEAGCGTSPLAHATSSASAHTQGCLGIFEVFVDTIVLCTLSALVIIVSGALPNGNAMDFVISAFYGSTGDFGKYGVLVCAILFALATVATQFFYGLEALSFISSSKAIRYIFCTLFFATIIIGATIPMSLMWEISDLAIALMTIFNLTCIVILHKKIEK